MKSRKNSSELEGTFETRVFIGGSYSSNSKNLLDEFERSVLRCGFVPIIADKYEMSTERLHDVTLSLLHACKYAVFDATSAPGALMEIERLRDYGTQAMILYHIPGGDCAPTQMLRSLALSSAPRIQIEKYFRPSRATLMIESWLNAQKNLVHESHPFTV